MLINVKFLNLPVIKIAVNNSDTGRLYFDLTKQINEKQQPFYRDTISYTTERMVELAQEAKKVFGWEWLSDSYDISITAKLHKDLENYVGRLSFHSIPSEHDQLLYDLHHCLHAIQFEKTGSGRSANLQIEWFTDESVPLPNSFEFSESCNFGDLILINPYVGHNPLQIFLENDFESLNTTCKFHDVIKPGIVLSTSTQINKDQILVKFKDCDPEFVKQHGEEKIRYYTGAAVVGKVVDPELFRKIKQHSSTLVLEKVEFIE
jgi:hypothetical protein